MAEDLRRELDEIKQLCVDMQKEIKKINFFREKGNYFQGTLNDALCDRLNQLDAINADFQSRLLTIEAHCFPGIKAGHDAVRKVIGAPEDEEYSRFDYRHRSR